MTIWNLISTTEGGQQAQEGYSTTLRRDKSLLSVVEYFIRNVGDSIVKTSLKSLLSVVE